MAAAMVLPIIEAAPVIIPLIENAVHMVEDLFQGKAKTGAQKRDAAIGIINTGLSAYGAVAPLFGQNVGNPQDVKDAIGVTVDAVVNLYNVLGIFFHPPTANPTPAPMPA